MASPAPPPVQDLLAELATLVDLPPDLPALLALLPGADLSLQDELRAALHPTLTRVWSPRGRRGQRHVEAPGRNAKVVGSKRVRAFLADHPDEVVLVYTPAYDPDANRIEWLWRVSRRAVTHAHDRATIEELTADLTGHFAALAAAPAAVLRHVGSAHTPAERQHPALVPAA